jgi:hypothetical protein
MKNKQRTTARKVRGTNSFYCNKVFLFVYFFCFLNLATSLLKIVLRLFLRIMSLKRSKSLLDALWVRLSRLFDQEEAFHLAIMSSAARHFLRAFALAERGTSTLKLVREMRLKLMDWRGQPVVGPSIKACFFFFKEEEEERF